MPRPSPETQPHANHAVVLEKRLRLGEDHVAPLVEMADRIAAAEGLHPGAVPYPDPTFGGTRARLLFLLDSPGPRAKAQTGGSGLISVDNADPTAARMHAAYRRLGIDRSRCLHWNVCPFPTAKDQSSPGERARAVPYTRELLSLLPELAVVVLLGRAAEDGWRRTSRLRPGLRVLVAPHPSNRGINAVPGNEARFLAAMTEAANLLTAAA